MPQSLGRNFSLFAEDAESTEYWNRIVPSHRGFSNLCVNSVSNVINSLECIKREELM
jgi:hypothetical protein